MGKKVKTKASAPLSMDLENRTMEVVMTTRTVDRDGDIVETKGINTDDYLENPVVLWAHNASIPPIGKVLEITKEDDHMKGLIKFADTEMAEEIFQLYVGGFLKTWSIGFGIGKNVDFLEDENGNVKGYHIKESSLYELSAVPVPANPEALVRACKGLKDNALKESIFKAVNVKEAREVKTLDTFTEEEISSSAFEKSSKEAGGAGKIPVSVSFGKEAKTEVEFEVIKSDGSKVTEARIKSLNVVLSMQEKTEPLTPNEEPSRDEKPVEKTVDAESIRKRAAARTIILEASNFC